jgi:hypothetical protein
MNGGKGVKEKKMEKKSFLVIMTVITLHLEILNTYIILFMYMLVHTV